MRIPDAELEVLKALWVLGPSPIKTLAKLLYPRGGPSAHATVQKLLERLAAKSCVERRPQGRRHIYRAVVKRSHIIERRLKETADQLCQGSMTPLLTQLVHSASLNKGDLEELRQLIDDLAMQEDSEGSGK